MLGISNTLHYTFAHWHLSAATQQPQILSLTYHSFCKSFTQRCKASLVTPVAAHLIYTCSTPDLHMFSLEIKIRPSQKLPCDRWVIQTLYVLLYTSQCTLKKCLKCSFLFPHRKPPYYMCMDCFAIRHKSSRLARVQHKVVKMWMVSF